MTQYKTNIVARWRSVDESWRYAVIAFLIARIAYAVWSFVIFSIQPIAIQNFEQSGEPIVSIFSLEENRGYVYLRQVGGKILTFQAVNKQQIRDQQTGSIWNIADGSAVQGAYQHTTLPKAKTTPADIFPYHGAKPYQGVWPGMWQRFDANWYVAIAENGYGTIPGDDHFPPLFPLLIRLLQPLFGSAYLAGLLLSHAATIVMLKLLHDVYMQWDEPSTARKAILLFVIYPTFFFFFSAYSESLFVVLALLSFQAMQHRHWAWAGFWTFCAILTRLQGAALLAPMLYLMWKDQPILQKFEHWISLAVAGLGGIFYLFLRSRQVTGGAVPFAESAWHAHLVMPWETYGYAVNTMLSGNASFIDVLNWAVMTLFIVLLIWGWKKIPFEYNIYTACSILIILIRVVETQPLISMSRYSLTLFPTFYALSLLSENPWIRRLVIYTSILLNLYLSGQFFLWGWVA